MNFKGYIGFVMLRKRKGIPNRGKSMSKDLGVQEFERLKWKAGGETDQDWLEGAKPRKTCIRARM